MWHFCSYFPYPAKLCLNGHEFLKCQLQQRDVSFEALDNGLRTCADVKAAQRIADGLGAPRIDRFFRKWLARLPHPYSAQDRAAGYRYDLSIWQAEFSLTQIWDRADHGRAFFEELIRENQRSLSTRASTRIVATLRSQDRQLCAAGSGLRQFPKGARRLHR